MRINILSKRRTHAEFAMIGGTIKQTTTQNNYVINGKSVYVYKDGDNYRRIKDAFKHQVIIDLNTKKMDR